MGGSGIRLSRFLGRASQTDAAAGQRAVAFDLVTFAAPADLNDLLVTFRAFHTHFPILSVHDFCNPLTRPHISKIYKGTISQK